MHQASFNRSNHALKAACMACAAEQSSSAGLLVADQLHVGDGSVEVVFGCETKETGEIYNQEADGILGLGNSEVSLINQARPWLRLERQGSRLAEADRSTLRKLLGSCVQIAPGVLWLSVSVSRRRPAS